MDENNEINIDIKEKIKNETEKLIDMVLNDGIQENNIDFLGKVVDIHKDISNEKYWETKEDFMMYRGNYRSSYGDYPSMNYGRSRDSRGRYNEGRNSSYGRRYKGHDMLDDMYENYGTYEEGKQEYNRGNYGAKEDSMKSLEYMLQSAYDFMCMLKDDAESQEEVELVQHYARKISEM